MSNENEESKKGTDIQVHVSPDLDYLYRDFFNVFVGTGDVVMEFGNIHRSMPQHATLSNRIVLSVPNAYRLLEILQKALQDAQIKTQQMLNKQKS